MKLIEFLEKLEVMVRVKIKTSKMIGGGDFAGIGTLVAEAVDIVHQVRQIGEKL